MPSFSDIPVCISSLVMTGYISLCYFPDDLSCGSGDPQCYCRIVKVPFSGIECGILTPLESSTTGALKVMIWTLCLLGARSTFSYFELTQYVFLFVSFHCSPLSNRHLHLWCHSQSTRYLDLLPDIGIHLDCLHEHRIHLQILELCLYGNRNVLLMHC